MVKPPKVDLDVWKNLHDEAFAYAQLRPWETLSDQNLFAFKHPLGDETLYACTIGQEKISYGLLLYRGAAGYASYQWLSQRGPNLRPDVEEYLSRQNQISLEFVPAKQLDKFDRAVIKDLGWSPSKASRWAQFRTQRPFEPPWYLDETEAILLTLALAYGVNFIGRFRKGKIPPPPSLDWIPTYEFSESPEGKLPETGLILKWNPPPIHRPPPIEPLPIDPVRITEILKSTKPLSGAWEVDASLMKIVIGGGDRPFLPLVVLIVDQGSGFILETQLSEEAIAPHKVLAEGILKAMVQSQMRPAVFLVKKGPMAARLAPLAKALGIPITETTRLPMLSKASQAMNKHFVR